jgi:hypothetical protein
MYFDGQLHYLDKDRQSTMSQKPTSYERAQTADPTTSSTPSPQQPQPQPQSQAQPQQQTSSSASMPKSQTVTGAAGDLHSMALKSAISNIGMNPTRILG